MTVTTATAAIRTLRLQKGSRGPTKAGASNANANCGGLAIVVATSIKANTANSAALAGRSLVSARDAIATTRIESLMSNASCEAAANCDSGIGGSSVAKGNALPPF